MINMRSVLIILAIFSILFGFITKDIFVGLGTNFFFMDNSNEVSGCTNLLLCWLKFNSTKCTRITFNSGKFVEVVKLNYCTIKLYPSWGSQSFLTYKSYLRIYMFANKNLILLGQWRYSSFIYNQPKDALMKNNEQLTPFDPWFITGFADAEGSFMISITQDKNLKIAWQVRLIFYISLHKKDKTLLHEIKEFFVVGSISQHGEDAVHYKISSIKDLQFVIDHFDRFSLITQKKADYELLKQAFILIKNKEHITLQGLKKIVAIRAALNLGLTDQLKAAFPNTVPVIRPSVIKTLALDPNWVTGFTSGEGCFLINIYKATTNTGEAVKLVFQLVQHSRDEKLMKSLIRYFHCGNTYRVGNIINYKVTTLCDISPPQNIIPFFKKHPIKGVKSQDFDDWCKVAEMMKEKKHLTVDGLEKIKKIKAGMNRGRK